MNTFDEEGYVEPGSVYFQFKAMEELKVRGAGYPYDLDIRDYNLWIAEKLPVVLILFDARRRRGYWLPIQQYFAADIGAGRKRAPEASVCEFRRDRS